MWTLVGKRTGGCRKVKDEEYHNSRSSQRWRSDKGSWVGGTRSTHG